VVQVALAVEGTALPVESNQRGRFYEPVEIQGEFFPGMTGAKIADLGLYAWRKGGWRPVLFQVDEKTPEGNFVMTRGPEANPADADGVLHDRDVIVFMAREAGRRGPDHSLPEGAKTRASLELKGPGSGESSWVYLSRFENGAPNHDLKPVSRLLDQGKAFRCRFPTYRYDALVNDPEKNPTPTINIDRLWILPEAGGNGKNIIDRQKTRGMITFLGGMIKIRFSESIVNGGIVAYKPGPVRILSHSYMYPRFPMGIKGPGFSIDSILVDTLTLTATTIRVPFNPGAVMHRMKLALGMDLTPDAKGMVFYNSENREGFRIDGRMDDREKDFRPVKDEWRVITGPPGTQIIITRFDPMLFEKGEIRTTYNDDESDEHPPENHPGDVGAVFDELTIKSLPAGSYRIDVTGCNPWNAYDPAGLNREFLEEVLDLQREPLILRAGGRETRNKGGLTQVLTGPERKE
jgi:hypothetical protein